MPKIPDAVLCNLKCSRCRNWISCGPIRLLPSGKTLCGRCQVHKDGPKGEYRHFAFEALACYFKFPCKYFANGCPERLGFKKVLEHEKKCSYSSCCGMFFRHPIALCQPRKYLNRREVIPFEVIPDEVLQYLRCGTCAGYLSSSPVQVCRDGTSVCHRCCKQLVPNSEFIKDEDFQKLVYIMIFPCIYRYHGCAEFFKYGQESEDHEKMCPYGKPRSNPHKNANRQQQISQIIKKQDSLLKNGRNNNKEVIINEPIVRRQESMLKPGQKERGVIETHRGHIYATLTPNAPLFALKSQTSKQNGYDEFQLYRENLANKWGGAYQNQNSETNNFQDIRNSANPTQQEQNDYNDTASQEGSISERIDSMFEDIVVDNNPYPSVITELKIKQKHNYKLGNQSNNNNNQSPQFNREMRDSQPQRQLTDYSVHN